MMLGCCSFLCRWISVGIGPADVCVKLVTLFRLKVFTTTEMFFLESVALTTVPNDPAPMGS